MPAAAPFAVEIMHDLTEASPLLKALAADGCATPFQDPVWLENWFAAIGLARAVEPLFLIIRRQGEVRPCLILPLITRLENGLAVIEPPDLGLTDYNAPLVARGERFSEIEKRMLWRAIREALPKADIFRFLKMPEEIDGLPNPLLVHGIARRSPFNTNLLTIAGDWQSYHHSLEPRFRREIERSWRVFQKSEGATFTLIEDKDEAIARFDQLAAQQAAKMARIGSDYRLDTPAIDAFYHALIADGLGSGYVRIGMLSAKGELVGAVLGIARGPVFAMLRLSSGSEAWSRCSPGRLVLYKTMEALHGQGFKQFDFTIGDYDYKRRLGVERKPLYTLIEALSLRGRPVQMRDALRWRLQLSPSWIKINATVRGLRA